jgi:Aspartyl protease
MIVLSFDADARGRLVFEVYMTASVPRLAAVKAVGETSPAPIAIRALVDTGASRTMVQRSALEKLDLDPVGVEYVHTASTGTTPKEVRAFAVQLFLAGVPGGQFAPDLRVLEADDLSGLGVDMLLGRDVLGHAVLFLNGPEARFTLALAPPP